MDGIDKCGVLWEIAGGFNVCSVAKCSGAESAPTDVKMMVMMSMTVNNRFSKFCGSFVDDGPGKLGQIPSKAETVEQ